jgi:hypothetical protein
VVKSWTISQIRSDLCKSKLLGSGPQIIKHMVVRSIVLCDCKRVKRLWAKCSFLDCPLVLDKVMHVSRFFKLNIALELSSG